MVRAGEFSPNFKAAAAPAPVEQHPLNNHSKNKRAGNYGEFEDVITSTGRFNHPNYNTLNPANSLGNNLHQITSTLSHLQRFVEPGAEDDDELLMKDPYGDVLPYRGPNASNSAPPFQNWNNQPSNGASNSAPPFQNFGSQPPRRESIPYGRRASHPAGNVGMNQGRQVANHQSDPYRRASDSYHPSFHEKNAGRRGSFMFGEPKTLIKDSYPFRQEEVWNKKTPGMMAGNWYNNEHQQQKEVHQPQLTRPPPRGKGRHNISQTSFDIDEQEDKRLWEEEMRVQREYKKRLDEEQRRKERLEDERLEAKVQADQARMREEYENELKQKKKKDENRQKRIERAERFQEKFIQEQNAKARAAETQAPLVHGRWKW